LIKPRNKFEKRINTQLKKSKLKYSYESERIPYVLARHYIPDFIIHTPLGTIYVECKGYLRTEDKAKLVAVKRQHPNRDLRILFYRTCPNYIRWAERNGLKWAVSKIPEDWLRGL